MGFRQLTLDGMVAHASKCQLDGPVISPEAAKDIAEKHAAAEVKRVLQEIRDGGFCPDNDFREHINLFIGE